MKYYPRPAQDRYHSFLYEWRLAGPHADGTSIPQDRVAEFEREFDRLLSASMAEEREINRLKLLDVIAEAKYHDDN